MTEVNIDVVLEIQDDAEVVDVASRAMDPLPLPAAIAKPKVKRPAKKLEDMETMDHLGKGAFGTVYKVRHKPSGRIMALKTMSKELIQKTGKNEHIKNEKRILQIAATYAKSPYLIKLHYSFHDENLLYLAMEYCPGGDLLKLIENIGYFSENQAKLYFAEMIMAVHSLHSLGFLHRDLKPENFLIDTKGHIKLADFGLSKQGLKREVEAWDDYKKQRDQLSQLPELNNSTQLQTVEDISEILRSIKAGKKPKKKLTLHPPVQAIKHFEAHSIVGTPPYMSPEVIPSGTGTTSSAAHGYGKEVDWWSLGCVFYEMLTGNYPFEGASESEIFESIRNYAAELPSCIAVLQEVHSATVIDLVINGFLSDAKSRLGKDLKKVQQHLFFKDWDWEGMEKMTPDPDLLIILKENKPEMDINLDEILGKPTEIPPDTEDPEQEENTTPAPPSPSVPQQIPEVIPETIPETIHETEEEPHPHI